jgi:hypothetical protein
LRIGVRQRERRKRRDATQAFLRQPSPVRHSLSPVAFVVVFAFVFELREVSTTTKANAKARK